MHTYSGKLSLAYKKLKYVIDCISHYIFNDTTGILMDTNMNTNNNSESIDQLIPILIMADNAPSDFMIKANALVTKTTGTSISSTQRLTSGATFILGIINTERNNEVCGIVVFSFKHTSISTSHDDVILKIGSIAVKKEYQDKNTSIFRFMMDILKCLLRIEMSQIGSRGCICVNINHKKGLSRNVFVDCGFAPISCDAKHTNMSYQLPAIGRFDTTDDIYTVSLIMANSMYLLKGARHYSDITKAAVTHLCRAVYINKYRSIYDFWKHYCPEIPDIDTIFAEHSNTKQSKIMIIDLESRPAKTSYRCTDCKIEKRIQNLHSRRCVYCHKNSYRCGTCNRANDGTYMCGSQECSNIKMEILSGFRS